MTYASVTRLTQVCPLEPALAPNERRGVDNEAKVPCVKIFAQVGDSSQNSSDHKIVQKFIVGAIF